MPSNEIYLINGIKGLRKIRKPFLILWIDIKNKSEPLTCYDDLVRIIMIWCGRQELNRSISFYMPLFIRLTAFTPHLHPKHFYYNQSC